MNDLDVTTTIALELGWTSIEFIGNQPVGKKPGCDHYNLVPDFLGDLNVMHEVVKAKFPKGSLLIQEFEGHLQFFCDYPTEATARQRAEAFLKTVGKWKEGE